MNNIKDFNELKRKGDIKMSKITKATKKNPIEIEITVKQGKEVNTKKFKIYGIVDAYRRADELKEIPKLTDGKTDNWLISKTMCEKEGGRLPTTSELAIIASLQEEKLIETEYYGYFWSASEVSSYLALRRHIDSYDSGWDQCNRYRRNEPLCLAD